MPANQDFLSKIAVREPLDILARSLDTASPTFVRINAAKIREASTLHRIAPFLGQRVPWCATGYALTSRPGFTSDPAMHQGLYYVQDSSSMSVTAAVESAVSLLGPGPLRCLDLCAAPGGKTTAALAALPAGSIIAANEYDYKRAEILAENVAKWGIPRVVVTRGDTSRYANLPGHFDIVIVDAPCSGEGMMRKDAKAAEQWSMQLVRECTSTQREILDNAWTALSPGGCLIYSTCTFNTIENEANVRYLIDSFDASPIEIAALEEAKAFGVKPGMDCDFPCYRFIPGHVEGEGQFIALLRKPHSAAAAKRALKAGAKGRKGEKAPSLPINWLEGDWGYWMKGDEIFGAPASVADDIRLIADKADSIAPGLHVGTMKGRDIVPAQPLALCADLRLSAFPTSDVDYDTAISYLQRQALTLNDAPKGFVLITYEGRPLGFVKNLGNRANNLYPKEWRIVGTV